VVYITGTIKERKSTKMINHNALQIWCLHTTSTDRSKNTLTAPQLQRRSLITMQGSCSVKEMKAF